MLSCWLTSGPSQALVQTEMGRPVYTSMVQALRTILANEGASGLYVGWLPSVAKNVPSMSLQLVVYEAIKNAMLSHTIASQQVAPAFVTFSPGQQSPTKRAVPPSACAEGTPPCPLLCKEVMLPASSDDTWSLEERQDQGVRTVAGRLLLPGLDSQEPPPTKRQRLMAAISPLLCRVWMPFRLKRRTRVPASLGAASLGRRTRKVSVDGGND